MQTIYKNATRYLLEICDINIKFSPSGTRGDIVDLAKLVPMNKMAASTDLQNAVNRGLIVPYGQTKIAHVNTSNVTRQQPNNVNQPHAFVVREPQKDMKGPKPPQPQMFVVYQKNNTASTSPLREGPTVYVKDKGQLVNAPALTKPTKEITADSKLEDPPETLNKPEYVSDSKLKTNEHVLNTAELDPARCAFVKKTGEQCKKKPQTEGCVKFCYLHDQMSQ